MSQPPVLQQRRDNWWNRNWKWFVPVLCVGAVIAFTTIIALLVSVVFGAMKSSGAYKEALAAARADARVVNALGSPVKEGWFVNGSIHFTGPSGNADLSIPISGPKGKGTIYAVATKSAGMWTFSKLVFETKGGSQRFDLAPVNPDRNDRGEQQN